MKRPWLMVAGLALSAMSAYAQRVSWSVTIGRKPCITIGTERPVYVVTPAPAPIVVVPDRGRTPVVVHPPVVAAPVYPDPYVRSGVWVYARGPRRIYHPFGYGHGAFVQEWCPVQRIWITIGRAPPYAF